MPRLGYLLPLAAFAVLIGAAPSRGETIIDEWQTIKAPPAPQLKPVTLDPKTTALLVMDLVKPTCNVENRPRCVASIPGIARLIGAARASGAMLVYTTFGQIPITDTLPAVAPKGNEPAVVSFVDKFMLGDKDTGLEKLLKDKGITAVVSVGNAAHGAVLYTSTAAALRGFNVVVPVDGMSGIGQNPYVEQYVAYQLTNAPVFSPKVTLTSIDMIKFAH